MEIGIFAALIAATFLLMVTRVFSGDRIHYVYGTLLVVWAVLVVAMFILFDWRSAARDMALVVVAFILLRRPSQRVAAIILRWGR